MDIAFLVLRLVVNSSISCKCDKSIRSVSKFSGEEGKNRGLKLGRVDQERLSSETYLFFLPCVKALSVIYSLHPHLHLQVP